MLCGILNFYIIECGDPPEPENCTVSYTSTTVGSVAIYSCNTECHSNKYTRICEGNGSTATWTEPEYYCQGKHQFSDINEDVSDDI